MRIAIRTGNRMLRRQAVSGEWCSLGDRRDQTQEQRGEAGDRTELVGCASV